MADPNYSIDFAYNFGDLSMAKTSRRVFGELGKRRLAFTSRPSEGTEDFNAVRVFIRHMDEKTAYSPHTEGMEKLGSALDKLLETPEPWKKP